MNNEHPLFIFDTHVWLWMVNGDKRIATSPVLPAVEDALGRNEAAISIISVWKTAMLEAKGRISFTMDCAEWIKQSIERTGLRVAELTPTIAVASTRLPGNFHGDPADRIIVATARSYDAALVTHDSSILKYGYRDYLRLLAV